MPENNNHNSNNNNNNNNKRLPRGENFYLILPKGYGTIKIITNSVLLTDLIFTYRKIL